MSATARTVRDESPRRPRFGWSIAAGALAFLLAMGAGLAFVASRPARWSAKASIVVLPARRLDPGVSAGYYDTLSRGQIPATVAEILRLQRVSGVRDGDVKVSIVPDTALITVQATSSSRSVAESAADRVMLAGSANVAELIGPYTTTVVSAAKGRATRTGLAKVPFAVVSLVVAAAVALTVQQAVYQLTSLLGAVPGRRPDEPVEEPVVVAPPLRRRGAVPNRVRSVRPRPWQEPAAVPWDGVDEVDELNDAWADPRVGAADGYDCPDCGAGFDDERALVAHVRAHHPVVPRQDR